MRKLNKLLFRYDYLIIYDGASSTSPMIGKYCGDSIPPSHVSSSNEVLIHFHSIAYYGKKAGFKMEYNPLGNTKFKTTLNTMEIIRVLFISRWIFFYVEHQKLTLSLYLFPRKMKPVNPFQIFKYNIESTSDLNKI